MQIKNIPATVRAATGWRWGKNTGLLLGLKKIIQEDWCGYLTYNQCCPYSPRRPAGCHPKCVGEIEAVAAETKGQGLGYFRTALRQRRVDVVERVEAVRESGEAVPEPEGPTDARSIVDEIMREMNAD